MEMGIIPAKGPYPESGSPTEHLFMFCMAVFYQMILQKNISQVKCSEQIQCA